MKRNVYYLEDSSRDFREFNLNLSCRQYDILPGLDDWRKEIQVFQLYLQNDSVENRRLALDVLDKYEIDLFILDLKIDDVNSAGILILKNLLLTNDKYKNTQFIILTVHPGSIDINIGTRLRFCQKYLGHNGVDYRRTSKELNAIIAGIFNIKWDWSDFIHDIS